MASTSIQQGLQDQVLSIVSKSQAITLDAIKMTVDTVQVLTPKVPAMDIPFAGKLPKPEEVVAGSYDFAEKLLAGQRKFADDMVKVTTPLLPGTGDIK